MLMVNNLYIITLTPLSLLFVFRTKYLIAYKHIAANSLSRNTVQASLIIRKKLNSAGVTLISSNISL